MKQFARKRWTVVLLMLFGIFLGLSAGTRKVSASLVVEEVDQCKVVFTDSKGKVSSKSLKKWAKVVDEGTTIKLPNCKKSGYQCVWAIKSNGIVKKKYAPGQAVKITKNTRFYLLTYKLYTVRFYTADGKSQYKNLAKTVRRGKTITLPSSPVTSKTRIITWSTSVKGKKTLRPGASVKVTSNMKFYVVERSTNCVSLRLNTGAAWKAIDNSSGTATFPDINLKTNDMCLGWSRTKGQSTKPEYYGGDRIPAGSGTYYMVVFKASMDRAPSMLEIPATYDKVYFVGDSRTRGLANSLGTSKSSKVDLVYRAGQGLDWFIEEGYAELTAKLSSESSTLQNAVIFNLGINDLDNLSRYVTCMKKYATKLEKYNCDLYFMSLNPFNAAIYTGGREGRSTAKIINFNNTIKQSLCSGSSKCFEYIDTFSSLRRHGWISQGENSTQPDGLHYSRATYLRIYNYCIQYLNTN